jgi:signal peptidase II
MTSMTGTATREWLSSRARGRWLLFFGIAAAVVILDQLTKAWVASSFSLASVLGQSGVVGGPTQVIGDWVRIAVTHNTGGIFGLLGDSAVILGLASLIVIGFIVAYEARAGVISHPILTVALGLLLGGAIGNLIDRLRLGYVVDWVDMGIGNTRWYTFNVSDAAISISLVLLIGISFLGDRITPRAGGGAPRNEVASN